MTKRERQQREEDVCQARRRGLTWRQIEERLGVRERTGREMERRYFERVAAESAPAPRRVADEALAALEEKIGELEELALDTKHDHVRLGALRAAADLQRDKLELLARLGRVPASLAAISATTQIQDVMRRFADLLREHNIPDEVVKKFEALAADEAAENRRRWLGVAA